MRTTIITIVALLAAAPAAADEFVSGTLGTPGGGDKCIWTTITPLGSDPIMIGKDLGAATPNAVAQISQNAFFGSWVVGREGKNGTVLLNGSPFLCGGQSTRGVVAWGP